MNQEEFEEQRMEQEGGHKEEFKSKKHWRQGAKANLPKEFGHNELPFPQLHEMMDNLPKKNDLDVEREGQAFEFRTTEKPAIVEHFIKPVQTVEVQPVIHREREQLEVHRIVQPLEQQEVRPVASIREETLPVQEMGIRKMPQGKFDLQYESSLEHAFTTEEKVTVIQEVKKPIIQETIRKVIIEEIQPVIHKQTIIPHIVRTTLPIHEKIIEAPIFVREVQILSKEEADLLLKKINANQEAERISLPLA